MYRRRTENAAVVSGIAFSAFPFRDFRLEYMIASVTRPNGPSSNTNVTVADQPIAERTFSFNKIKF